MMDTATFKRLVQEAPEAVMVRTVLEHALEPETVNEVFEESRDDQYTRTLLFSSIVGLMSLVVCRVRRSVSSAYKMYRDRIGVSLKSVYNKLNATDPTVCRALFLHAAWRMRCVVDELGVPERPLVAGYKTRIPLVSVAGVEAVSTVRPSSVSSTTLMVRGLAAFFPLVFLVFDFLVVIRRLPWRNDVFDGRAAIIRRRVPPAATPVRAFRL